MTRVLARTRVLSKLSRALRQPRRSVLLAGGCTPYWYRGPPSSCCQPFLVTSSMRLGKVKGTVRIAWPDDRGGKEWPPDQGH